MTTMGIPFSWRRTKKDDTVEDNTYVEYGIWYYDTLLRFKIYYKTMCDKDYDWDILMMQIIKYIVYAMKC